MMTQLLLWNSFIACGLKDAPVETAAPVTPSRENTEKPAPLKAPSFTLPELERGELSNGIPVLVSKNSETPLVTVQVVFNAGEWNTENPQLANAAMDMLTEGAGEYDSAGLSAEQRRLAADLSSYAGLDGSAITLSSLKKNLEDSLGLLDLVVSAPTFPTKEWKILQRQYRQQLQASQQDSNSIAGNLFDQLMYTGQYAGRSITMDDIDSITTEQMQGWYTDNIHAANASIYVGGDTTLEEVLPLLEARFADFPTSENKLPDLPTGAFMVEEMPTTVHLVDSPGASQSVIYAGQFVSERTDDNADELYLANLAVGGLFIARINMNLREDKGWTYGARSTISYNHLPGLFTVRTSVVAEHTANSLSEILKELRDSQSERLITQEELEAARGYILGTEPLRYENPSYLLSQMIQVGRYNLPADWFSTYNDKLRSATLENAQEVWNGTVDPNKLVVVIVGDAASLKAPLIELGLPVVEMDASGTVLTGADSAE
jgi:zinc protease